LATIRVKNETDDNFLVINLDQVVKVQCQNMQTQQTDRKKAIVWYPYETTEVLTGADAERLVEALEGNRRSR
jgi:myo-inositol-1-phosphate synthase